MVSLVKYENWWAALLTALFSLIFTSGLYISCRSLSWPRLLTTTGAPCLSWTPWEPGVTCVFLVKSATLLNSLRSARPPIWPAAAMAPRLLEERSSCRLRRGWKRTGSPFCSLERASISLKLAPRDTFSPSISQLKTCQGKPWARRPWVKYPIMRAASMLLMFWYSLSSRCTSMRSYLPGTRNLSRPWRAESMMVPPCSTVSVGDGVTGSAVGVPCGAAGVPGWLVNLGWMAFKGSKVTGLLSINPHATIRVQPEKCLEGAPGGCEEGPRVRPASGRGAWGERVLCLRNLGGSLPGTARRPWGACAVAGSGPDV